MNFGDGKALREDGMRRMVMAGGVMLALGVAGAIGWFWLAPSEPTAEAWPAAAGEAMRATGERVYATHCAACHGATGQGEPNWRQRKANGRLPAPPLNGDGHTWHHADRHLYRVIADGIEALAPDGYESDMKGFGDRLSREEIVAVVAYVKQWWPPQALERQQQITARTEARH
jgi:mono/diheme cytochrome c family protein